MAESQDTQAPVVDEDEAILAPLRAKHAPAELQLIRPDKRVGPLVFRAPKPEEYMAWRRTLADDMTKHTATHNLFVSLCVYPANGASMLDRLPGLLDSKAVQKTLAYLSGSIGEAEGKG